MLWINVDYIKRLVDRLQLGLTPKEPRSLPLAEYVQPITSIDELLRLERVASKTVGHTGVGAKDQEAVPGNERWEILSVEFNRATGDRTINAWGIEDPDGATCKQADITPAITYASGTLSNPLPLDAGGKIWINLTGGSVDGNWISAIYKRRIYDREI